MPGSLSFPTGHKISATGFAAALVIVFWPTRWRRPALAAATVYAAGIGLTRCVPGRALPLGRRRRLGAVAGGGGSHAAGLRRARRPAAEPGRGSWRGRPRGRPERRQAPAAAARSRAAASSWPSTQRVSNRPGVTVWPLMPRRSAANAALGWTPSSSGRAPRPPRCARHPTRASSRQATAAAEDARRLGCAGGRARPSSPIVRGRDEPSGDGARNRQAARPSRSPAVRRRASAVLLGCGAARPRARHSAGGLVGGAAAPVAARRHFRRVVVEADPDQVARPAPLTSSSAVICANEAAVHPAQLVGSRWWRWCRASRCGIRAQGRPGSRRSCSRRTRCSGSRGSCALPRPGSPSR